MIERIRGKLLAVDDEGLTVETGGIAWRVCVPTAVIARMNALLEGTGGTPTVALPTHLLVRPDNWQLFGFAAEDERALFRELLGISGVGPRLAMSVLSHLTTAEIRHAVAAREARVFESVPGIGKRTAARLVLELSGKLASEALAPPGPGEAGATRDAIDALAALGVGRPEALTLVRAAMAARPETGERAAALVAEALRLRQTRG
jgi:holliday junction DNA helicase RuvA